MIHKACLIGILAAGAGVLPGTAAANEISPPVHVGFFHQGTSRQAQPVPIALSPDEDKFLSLLRQKVESGGPPKDGIPAIDRPQYTSAREADQWLLPEDIVFGVDYKGLVAAYPQRILVWHEIANETVGNEGVSITYCPLTGTAIGFKTSSTFGVSGKLVNSNLIMYDRATDSRWPQILAKAIDGSSKGIKLEEFPIVWTTWEMWKKKHPNTKVLSRNTGFLRNYGKTGDPYGSYLGKVKGYYSSESVLFSPIFEDPQLHPKSVVVGVRDAAGNAAAILKNRLRRDKRLEVQLGNQAVVVSYDPAFDSHSAAVEDTAQWINSFDAMWFAWKGFYPNTQLLR
jgi:hypothetical protein